MHRDIQYEVFSSWRVERSFKGLLKVVCLAQDSASHSICCSFVYNLVIK